MRLSQGPHALGIYDLVGEKDVLQVETEGTNDKESVVGVHRVGKKAQNWPGKGPTVKTNKQTNK